MQIKQIIHQYWDGDIPDKYKYFLDCFKRLNKNYEHILWDKNLVLSKCSDHILCEYIKQSSGPVMSSDLSRIVLLDTFGGLYFDTDMRPERSIPDHLLENETFACYENENNLGQTIANGAIGSISNSLFLKKIINEIIKIPINKIKDINKNKSWLVFGPRLWTKVFLDSIYNQDQSIMIYPSWYFIPYHYSNGESIKKPGYITTHIWNKKYYNYKWKNIIHYSNNREVEIVDFREIIDLQKKIYEK